MARIIHKHIVIGSGLSALGAIRALVKNGHKPLILDTGSIRRNKSILNFANKEPMHWTENDRDIFREKIHTRDLLKIPKKTSLGSSFFYGIPENERDMTFKNQAPPFSKVMGGLAEGWGASFLPPAESDISDWPIKYEEVIKYFSEVISEDKTCFNEDDLSSLFPLNLQNFQSPKISFEDEIFLEKIKSNTKNNSNFFAGTSRLLLDNELCVRCGECMSGCLYNAIFKPSLEIISLIQLDKIDYLGETTVRGLVKKDNSYKITTTNSKNEQIDFFANKIYLGAGAVMSSKIILKSFFQEEGSLSLLSRGGYVVPGVFLKRREQIWPNVNTMPTFFFEYRDEISNKWNHIQFNSSNELLLHRLKLILKKVFLYNLVKRYLPNFTTLFISLNSSEAGSYQLTFDKETNILHSVYLKKKTNSFSRNLYLFKIFLKSGLFLFFPFKKDNSGTFHIGGSFPMSQRPTLWNETNEYGELKGYKNLFIIDSSILPNLPSTTIGILSMSNAYRISLITSKNEK